LYFDYVQANKGTILYDHIRLEVVSRKVVKSKVKKLLKSI